MVIVAPYSNIRISLNSPRYSNIRILFIFTGGSSSGAHARSFEFIGRDTQSTRSGQCPEEGRLLRPFSCSSWRKTQIKKDINPHLHLSLVLSDCNPETDCTHRIPVASKYNRVVIFRKSRVPIALRLSLAEGHVLR